MPANRTVVDIAETKTEPDEDFMNGILATHSSGIKVLLAPPQPENAELITHDILRHTLALMQKMFDYVVVDTGKNINDPLLTVLDMAEKIILISTADIPALKDAKLFFEITQKLEYPPTKTIMLLNQYEKGSNIKPQDIEANIKHPLTGVIPRDDKAMALAITRGIPVVLTQRGIPFSQAIFAVARLLKSEEQPTAAAAGVPAEKGMPASTPAQAADKNKKRFALFGRS